MGNPIVRIFALLVVLGAIAAAGYIVMQPGEPAVIGETDQLAMKTYDNDAYGLRFSYPESYVLTERDAEGSAQRMHHVITLVDAAAASSTPEAGEGPTAITVDLFDNRFEKLTTEAWIRNTSASNFKLSPEPKLAQASVSGLPAFTYSWDGLYRGESTVAQASSTIFMFSVTYLTPADQIRSDFDQLMAGVSIR